MISKNVDRNKIEAAVKMMLEAIGEDPQREGLVNTPARVAKMYEEIFWGIDVEPRDFLSVSFTEYHDELVLVKDIPYIPCANTTCCLFTELPMLPIYQGRQSGRHQQMARVGRSILGAPCRNA
jgi:GTP cyclohydrolase I